MGYVAPVRFRADCSTCVDLIGEGRTSRQVAGHVHAISETATYEVSSLRTDLFGIGVTPVATAAAIPDPVGGLTSDTAARDAITDILTVLRDVGLVAP